MRLLIVFFWRGSSDSCTGPYLSGRRTHAGTGRIEKKEKREDKGSKKKKVTVLLTLPPFVRVSAALLIRTDATHTAKDVCGDANSL